ncbi:MAG: SPOR domain-containing protein [Thiohalocapsa sp. PB-PSB1]|jgi:DedD protein|nr:MAG: hypothetical protein N838_03760 [Thiohalocapsa sp. PB-PSB1]QQO54895.1 MAG: SPOR domain-containing protein [Thiohalocapsa sp. PB-PSB1]HCS89190.1 SPOR domain-containing protein [Chromatiaceae bacterium]
MDEGAKRRLVGAAVLVALAVIFVPMLLDDKQSDDRGEPILIPDEPAFDAGFDDPDSVVESEITPALPSPESPTAAMDEDVGAGQGNSLPVPSPPQAEPATRQATPASPSPSPSRSQAQPRAAAAPTARPAAIGPKRVPAGRAAWIVQVASLGSPSAATRLQDELRGKGYAAFVEQATVNGKRYFRVRVGPETERGQADNLAARLERETGTKPLVQAYP